MITKAELAARVRSNLTDARILSTQLFIYNLLERGDAGPEVPRWRARCGGVDVTSLDDFVSNVTEANISVQYPYDGERFNNDRVTGVEVTVTGITVSANENSTHDAGLFALLKLPLKHEQLWNVNFFIAYMNDGDEVLPLKIANVRLVPSA